jgi:Bacterial Ig-like domain (group 2)
MRRSFAIIVVAAVVLSLASCHGFFTEPILTSITVAPSTVSLQVNQTQQMTATGVNDDSSTSTLTNVAWTTSDATIAQVSSTGLVTAKANGNATITATSGAISGTASVSVGTTSSLSITPPSTTVSLSTTTTVQFTAMSGGTNVTNSATWTSSNPGAAVMSPTTPGLALIQGVGQTTITATNSGATGNTTLNVTQ